MEEDDGDRVNESLTDIARAVWEQAEPALYNEILEAMAAFREVHFGWAQQHIHQWENDPRGTGGTPYMQGLRQLIEETRARKIR